MPAASAGGWKRLCGFQQAPLRASHQVYLLTFKNNGVVYSVSFFLSEQISINILLEFWFQSDTLGFSFFSFLFFFFSFLGESESLLFLLIGQLEKLVAAYLLEWKDSITEPRELAWAESCSKET